MREIDNRAKVIELIEALVWRKIIII
jgi:hypothetical protein